MSNKPLTRQQLDQAKCENPECTDPDCGTLYLHSRCHPRAALGVKYLQGVLTVYCAECEDEVTQVAVAPGQLN